MKLQANAKSALCSLVLAIAVFSATAPTAQAAPAPAPSWKLLAISAPTNLPPKQSEVQQAIVEAEGGTFKLKLGGQETTPIPFDASAAEIQSALQALPVIGPGAVAVSGGSGGDVEHPYLIAFGGSLAEQDVEELGADAGGLTGEHAFLRLRTAAPGGPGTGTVVVLPANNGGKASFGQITVTVGPLPAGILTSGPADGKEWECPGSAAGQSTVTCVTSRPVASLAPSPNPLDVPVEVQPNAPFSASAPVEISGGGAGAPESYELPLVVSNQPAGPGVATVWAGAFEADGSISVQAGAHPFSAGSYFMVNTVRTKTGRISPAGDLRDEVVDLPPGFVGNPLATKRCPQSTLIEPQEGSELCNKEMSVGFLSPFVGSLEEAANFEEQPLFNDVPPQGYAAEFSTRLSEPLQSVLATVRSDEDFGVRVRAFNNANFKKLFGAFAAFEGVPAKGNGQALLTTPTACAEQARETPIVRAKVDTWQEPGNFFEAPEVPIPPVVGCDALEIDPSFSLQPTSTTGSTPVGAVAHLHIPQAGLTDASKLAPPHLKRAEVTLPVGLALNPSAANGLEACSEAEIGYKGAGFALPNPMRFTEAQPQCPDGSKLGSVEVQTPLLEDPLVGSIYLAAEHENPFGSLIAIYLVVNDAHTGVIVKLPGKVDTDPQTGQVTATFDYNPQLPFEDLILHFRGGGPRSLMATPEVCGEYATKGSWTPWSAPESGLPAQTSDSFDVQGNCASSPAARPFSPSFEAGTQDPVAGAYSPLVIKLSRNDGEQELRKLDFTLPPGLLGRLVGVGYCPDSAIASAKAKSGKAELASASCPSDSHLGSIDATAGYGSEPIHVEGQIYLSGPYEGGPLSAVVVVPAVAGPIDLGNVLIKSPLRLNPETAKITATSGQIPTILEGIPTKLRSVSVKIDRKDFTLNPTNCEAMGIEASADGSSGAQARLHNRFQVGGCEKLPFKPGLFTRLYGPTRRGGFPKFRGIVTAKAGEANTGKLVVTLPHSEFLEQGHIRTVCTRVQFAADECPKGSIYGHISVTTPLLDYTLEGNAYLRSSSHKLPDLVLALKGPPSQPIEVELDGRIDSAKTGIRTTFDTVPDAPFTKAVLTMQGGKKGLLVNSRNICASSGRVSGLSTGQNGKRHRARPVLRNGKCGKGRKHRRHKRHRRRG